ncbi:MAG: lipoprotein-releasing ABC transporter ATP-binding protein LolD [Gammaproteobacteria bacterium]|nr:lipoprotein-releasing ABC transporter ATP-binding protein LolD [Gammaproteobacteria bacterium]
MNNVSPINSPDQTVLECKAVTKIFSDGKTEISVLKATDFRVQSSEMLAILGVSGAGKSTFLQILGGLDEPTSGEVLVAGINIHTLSTAKKGLLRNRYLGFIYQFHHLLAEFNALENVAMPLLIRGDSLKDAREKAAIILNKVGLDKRHKHRLGELSGGERQRVAIGRALVTEPVCVLADEPTGNLDKQTAMQVFELMLELNQDLKTSFIIVTHDLSFADRMGRTLTLENGSLT